jgi:acetyltransferase-like isoleucine patch superfamily enzyme/glycosyltransferase involved in cell wall biosynthesis
VTTAPVRTETAATPPSASERGSETSSAAPLAQEMPTPAAPAGFPPRGKVPISVVVLTLNEEVNIADCLASCAWSDDVHVLDSGSMDRTVEISRSLGAGVWQHPFTSFGEQRNWAIENIPMRHEWIFHLDADERFTPELARAMGELLARKPEEAGFHIPQKLMFMGRWLKRSAAYPTYQMRLFHRTRMRFCDYGHGQRELTEGAVGSLNVPYLHYGFAKGLYDWFDKHNRYSSLEALQFANRVLGHGTGLRLRDVLSGDRVKRRRAWKDLGYRLPFRAQLRWFVTLFVLGGILEGRAGLTYAGLISTYERMTSLKLTLLRQQRRQARLALAHRDFERDTAPQARTMLFDAQDRAPEREVAGAAAPAPHGARLAAEQLLAVASAPAAAGGPAVDRSAEAKGDRAVAEDALDVLQMRPEASPWTFGEKVRRAIWMLVGRPIFRMSFHNWYPFRNWLLRSFGARIGSGVALRPSVNIEVPWMIDLDDDATVGDHAILYSLGKIRIGKRAIISQYAHLCAGTHDYTDHTFKLLRTPITIGDDVWIGADAFVGPGVHVGRLTVLGARSSAYRDLPPEQVCVGNPARPIKRRELR